MNKTRKNMLSAVLLWGLNEGMEADANEVSSDILLPYNYFEGVFVFSKENIWQRTQE